MNTTNNSLKLILALAKFQSITMRKFDGRLGGGLGFNDFMVLYYLSQAEGEKMRRVDLSEIIGLTASGVTRLLVPMEKIGLVKRETNEHDARVSYVILSEAGKRILSERLERAEILAEESVPQISNTKIEEFTEFVRRLK